MNYAVDSFFSGIKRNLKGERERITNLQKIILFSLILFSTIPLYP